MNNRMSNYVTCLKDCRIYHIIGIRMISTYLVSIVKKNRNSYRYGCIHTTSMVGSTTSADRTRKIAITLPKSILQKIDNERGDIPRSRYILRAVEGYLQVKKGARIKGEH